MRTSQINALLSTRYLDRLLAEKVGILPIEIPSKYLVIGTNPPTLELTDPTVYVTWIPTTLSLDDCVKEIAELIREDQVFKTYIKETLPTNLWAMMSLSWKYLNDPELKPAYERQPFPNETPYPDKDKHVIQYCVHLIDIRGMNQDKYA